MSYDASTRFRPEPFSGEETISSFPALGEFRKEDLSTEIPEPLQTGDFVDRGGFLPLLQDWDNTGRRIRNTGVSEVSAIVPSNPTAGLLWLDTASSGPTTNVGVRVVDTFTADTTLTTAHDYVLVDTSAGAITITLPPASTRVGKQYDIKNIGNPVNDVTVDADGSETIDEALTAVLESQFERITIVNDGSNWHI